MLSVTQLCFRTGGTGGRRRRGVRKNERPVKSVADLDAEMEVGGMFT